MDKQTLEQQTIRGERELNSILQDLNFPATREQVMREIGDFELLWTQNEPITMNDILIEIHADHYDSLDDLKNYIMDVIHLSFGDRSVNNEAPLFS